ncbi:hypothetical protein GCM10009609_53450 [Pseudonocardia aurantiaca]|uniref:Uncharacterized protein n=1 Tax=Pseudonocardia aurantiaca TaxID=75290 RepID=A0ABW4FV58_9PSEU
MTHGTSDLSAGHEHDRHCYWDHMQCGWVCGPRPAAEPRAAAETPEQADATPDRSLAPAH